MTLSPGTRLGPYEIVAPLGAGGMGEVYRAKDPRLGREVAIKVLPTEVATDPERLRRFEQEARAASALNHPGILTVHDFGSQDGVAYLVTELLVGESLRELLRRGPLPPKRALEIASQIARGLAAAHERGIVHRDLKPDNLFVTRDGGAKILDFGLARVDRSELSQANANELSTRLETSAGTVLGTAGYMAPEQVRGQRADARSDLFSLGVVLHEMLTGANPFRRDSVVESLNALLKEEAPGLSLTRAGLSRHLDRLVRHCLEKSPDDRPQSARDLAVQLEWLLEESGPAAAPRPAATTRSSRLPWWLAAAAAALAVVAVIAVVALLCTPSRPPTSEAPIRFEVGPPAGWTFSLSGRDAGPVAVSPDGRQLAFVAADREGRKLLFVRSLSEIEPKPLAGTDGASYPFWSADSRFLAFFSDKKLKKVAAGGGPIQILCSAPLGRGGSWSPSGVILFATSSESPLYQVSDSGGTAAQVTRFDRATSFSSHRWPQFLPDGRHFLYQAFSFVLSGPEGGHALFLGSLDGGEDRLLLRADSKGELSRGGHLLFARGRTLLAAKFDSERLTLAPGTVPIAQALQQFPNTGSTIFSTSVGGVLAYQTGSMAPSSQLVWFDRAGRELGTLGPRAETEDPRISPDGRTVAVNLIDPETGITNIWLYALPGGAASRFTFAASFDHSAIWSPDGSRIAFDSLRKHPVGIYVKPRDGAEEERVIEAPEPYKSPTDWSLEGRLLLFQVLDPSTGWDLWSWSIGAAEPVPFLRTPTNELEGHLSGDGRWIAYASDETGSSEIYVAAFPGPGGKRQISRGGGTQPNWRRDGTELFYLAPDRRLMAVAVGAGTQPTFSAPQPLFQTRARNTGNRSYDVSPDGERFLISTTVVEPSFEPITVVLNWEEGLEPR